MYAMQDFVMKGTVLSDSDLTDQIVALITKRSVRAFDHPIPDELATRLGLSTSMKWRLAKIELPPFVVGEFPARPKLSFTAVSNGPGMS